MSILYRAFSHLALSIPVECPFFPTVEDGNVKLNKAYVIDYFSKGDGGLKVLPVEGTGNTTQSTGKLYLKITWNPETFAVQSASVSGSAGGDEENSVSMIVCETDSKGIKEVYVRENIHWMMIPKPKDKTAAHVLVFDKEGQTPGGPGQIKWLKFEAGEGQIEVVGGSKEKVKLIPTSKCPEEPQTE